MKVLALCMFSLWCLLLHPESSHSQLDNSSTADSPNTTASRSMTEISIAPTTLQSSTTNPAAVTTILPTPISPFTQQVAPNTTVPPQISLSLLPTSTITTNGPFIASTIQPTATGVKTLADSVTVIVVQSKRITTTDTSNPSPSSTPSDSSTTTVLEFVRDNPIAFTMIGISTLFVCCMCCCLVGAIIYRRRRSLSHGKSEIRRKSIIEGAGDVWIVNPGATLRLDSPILEGDIMHGIQTATQHIAAVNVLQTSPADDAVIITNPTTLDPSSQCQPHSRPMTTPTSSTSQLLPMHPIGSPEHLNPSAPPRNLI